MSIPFELPDLHGGFSEAKGYLRMEPEFLVFEIQVAVLGMFKDDAQQIKVEPGVIADITFDKGVFKDKIRILPGKFELVKAFPGKPAGEIILKTKRRHRDVVRSFVNDIRRWKHEAMTRKQVPAETEKEAEEDA